jgi:hypothetical protein
MDYGKEIQFSTMSKWIMERIRGFNSGVLGFKGFIMEKGKRNGKRKKLWKRMPTLVGHYFDCRSAKVPISYGQGPARRRSQAVGGCSRCSTLTQAPNGKITINPAGRKYSF